MPDAIAANYASALDAPIYFALGPIPPDSFLLHLYGLLNCSIDNTFHFAHVLTIQDVADAAAHAAGRRLLARSTVAYNTAPGYHVGAPAFSTPSWTLPMNTAIPGGAAWIITYVARSGGLATWSILLSVTWISSHEYARMYGVKPPITVIGVQPPVPYAPPGPPVEPDFGPA